MDITIFLWIHSEKKYFGKNFNFLKKIGNENVLSISLKKILKIQKVKKIYCFIRENDYNYKEILSNFENRINFIYFKDEELIIKNYIDFLNINRENIDNVLFIEPNLLFLDEKIINEEIKNFDDNNLDLLSSGDAGTFILVKPYLIFQVYEIYNRLISNTSPADEFEISDYIYNNYYKYLFSNEYIFHNIIKYLSYIVKNEIKTLYNYDFLTPILNDRFSDVIIHNNGYYSNLITGYYKIELTNKINTDCPFNPSNYFKNDNINELDINIFNSFIEQVKKLLPYILIKNTNELFINLEQRRCLEFVYHGEPLLHSKFENIIDIINCYFNIKPYKYSSFLYTNGILLTENLIEKVINNQTVWGIMVVINSYNVDSYKNIMGVYKFNEVYNNLQKLKKIRDMFIKSNRIYNSNYIIPYPKLSHYPMLGSMMFLSKETEKNIFNYLNIFGDNKIVISEKNNLLSERLKKEESINKLIKINKLEYKIKCGQITMKYYKKICDMVLEDKVFIDYAVIGKYNSFANQIPDKKVTNYSPFKRNYCKHFDNSLLIHSDGKVSICHQDINKKNIIGDLNFNSLIEIFNNYDFIKKRYESKNGKFNIIDLCDGCDEWYVPLF